MVRRQCTRRGQRGFTMIEVLASIVIFTTGSIGIVTLVNFLIKANSTSNDISMASNIASSTLETIQLTPYDQVLIGNTERFYHKNGEADPVPAEEYFTVFTTVKDVAAFTGKDIEVIVSWVLYDSSAVIKDSSGTVVDHNQIRHKVRLHGRIVPNI